MKKAIVCMGIGGPYERQLQATRPFREAYAARHGWDLVDVTEMDERSRSLGEGYSTALRCHLQKLLLPDTLKDRFDLVLFVESDVIINPAAPCISIYERFLPEGAFGAVACTLPQERLAVAPRRGQWPMEPRVDIGDFYMNGGVELYRPTEVAERWLRLFKENCGASDENLLNLFDAQQGRVLWLPSEWNRVWLYEKVRVGYTRRGGGVVTKALNRLKNRYLFNLMPGLETRAFRRHFPHAHFHHIAQEGVKVEQLAQAVSGALRN
jgi:hypothetical protein